MTEELTSDTKGRSSMLAKGGYKMWVDGYGWWIDDNDGERLHDKLAGIGEGYG